MGIGNRRPRCDFKGQVAFLMGCETAEGGAIKKLMIIMTFHKLSGVALRKIRLFLDNFISLKYRKIGYLESLLFLWIFFFFFFCIMKDLNLVESELKLISPTPTPQ